MSLLGVDVGTSAVKAVAFRAEDATALASARAEYNAHYPRQGRMELDPERVWAAFARVLRQVAADPNVRRDQVKALALSVSCDEVIPVDAAGRPLAPCIMAPDTRGTDVLENVLAILDDSVTYENTGLPISPIHPLVRILWYQQHEPLVAKAAARWLGWAEFLLMRMGLPPVTDETTAGRWLAFDVIGRAWIDDVLDAVGIRSKVPEVAAPASAIGTIGAAASSVGLRPEVTMVIGAFDQICAAVGAGLSDPGDIVVSSGTWENTTLLVDRPPGRDAHDHGITWGRYVDDRYAALVMNPGGGSVVRWLRSVVGMDRLGPAAGPDHRTAGADPYGDPGTKPGPLLFVPHLAGSLAPWRDPAAKGAFVGLTLATSRADMLQSVLEGISFELRLNLEFLSEGLGFRVPVRNMGGGARSQRWVQLKADILGMPVATLGTDEPGCLGAAILAGVGSGALRDVSSVQRQWCRPDRIVQPDAASQKRYDVRFQLYRQLYPAIRRFSAAL